MRSSNYLRQAKRKHSKTIESKYTQYSAEDKLVGKESIANMFDVSITTVERWIRDGMPVEQRGDQLHDWVFELAQVKQWRSAQFD
jgi:DNA invertase Pin-like site-specific DNA recombinase